MQNIQTTIQPASSHTYNESAFSWQYQPVKKAIFHPDLDSYTAYGLQLYHCQNGKRYLLASVDDISVDQEFIEQLAVRFTLHQLSPVHFLDAVYDAVADAASAAFL